MLTIEAPAKINLTLEVVGKRPDGYREIRSVLQALSLHDTLHFEKAVNLSFECDIPHWDADKSLVSRAAKQLSARSGQARGARVSLEKSIPLSSGLGGDSSDAAAAIKGLDQLWGLGMTVREMSEFAASLGSDVPFFLDGPTALAIGRGEVISALSSPPGTLVVLLLPDVLLKESKTGFMYSLLKPEYYTTGAATEELVLHLALGDSLANDKLYNVFEHVVFEAFAGLEQYWGEFRAAAGVPVHLAGAGPTLFAMFNDKERASEVARALKDRGLNVILTDTVCR